MFSCKSYWPNVSFLVPKIIPHGFWGCRPSIYLIMEAVKELLVYARPRGKPLPQSTGLSLGNMLWLLHACWNVDQSTWILCDFSFNGTKDLPSHVRAGFSAIWFRYFPGRWNEGTDLETKGWFIWWSKPECQSLNFPLVAHRVFWQTHNMHICSYSI